MENALIVTAILGYLAFQQWLVLKRKAMTHKERLAAIEKGTALPPFEEERRRSFNVQRLLLLAGLIWLSLGIATFVTLTAILTWGGETARDVPHGIQWVGLAPACIGLSHIIVFFVGRKKEI